LTCPARVALPVYATAGIALRIIAPHKPPYPAKEAFVKVEIPQGGFCFLTVPKFMKIFYPRSSSVSSLYYLLCRLFVVNKVPFCSDLLSVLL